MSPRVFTLSLSHSLSSELGEKEGDDDSTMAIEFRALPLTFVAHVLAIAGAIMVLVWTLYYRGGLAWDSANKNLIFNVSLSPHLHLYSCLCLSVLLSWFMVLWILGCFLFACVLVLVLIFLVFDLI